MAERKSGQDRRDQQEARRQMKTLNIKYTTALRMVKQARELEDKKD